MFAVVFSVLADARGLADQVDAGVGCPIAGESVGGGQHDDQPTTTYAPVIKHPTQALWAYPSDAVTAPYIAAAGLVAASLDSSWQPAANPPASP